MAAHVAICTGRQRPEPKDDRILGCARLGCGLAQSNSRLAGCARAFASGYGNSHMLSFELALSPTPTPWRRAGPEPRRTAVAASQPSDGARRTLGMRHSRCHDQP